MIYATRLFYDDDNDDDTRMANAFDLQEELQALQDTENYQIEHEHDVRSMEPGEMDGLLQRASQRSHSVKGDSCSRSRSSPQRP